MSWRVLIVDDEAPARERLRSLLEQIGGVTVVGEAAQGDIAVEMADELAPDIVLMDVRMPGMDGLEAARRIKEFNEPPAVIFTTAYDEYALNAFETQAAGYLLKPVRAEKLQAAIQQAGRLTRPQLAQAIGVARATEQRTHIAARNRDGVQLIPVDEVLYFQADQKYTTVRHRGGSELIEESLRSLEEEFPNRFVRIHRNALVNVHYLLAIERDAGGQYFVRLRDCEQRLAVSRRMAGDLRERFRI
ncbi:MAG: LytTR family DNA-binding domain-containing protein [Steroidobacteraceae bacterium]|nr:LytTR family DNA-binding domain-containing protein [Steroidobacteraceae bacterium]MDW8258957.1 LytTR family DNA-binding domain-containing protein [Gammaproteobacteria bacterium]